MKHIILIGFKNVGKSVIGAKLAELMGLPCVDLDTAIVTGDERVFGERLSCREIMNTRGEAYFRALEREVLAGLLQLPERSIIATGGGALVNEDNRALIIGHDIVHITAPKGNVFERIMMNGRPAFFAEGDDPFQTFQKIWRERTPVYQRLATHTVENNGPVETVAAHIQAMLSPINL